MEAKSCIRRGGGAHRAGAPNNCLSVHPASPSGHLEEPLKAPLLDSLTGQDVGELSIGVRDEKAGGHVLLDELGDARLRAGADGAVGRRAVRLGWLWGRGVAPVGHYTTGLPSGPNTSTLHPSAVGAPSAFIIKCCGFLATQPALEMVLCTAATLDISRGSPWARQNQCLEANITKQGLTWDPDRRNQGTAMLPSTALPHPPPPSIWPETLGESTWVLTFHSFPGEKKGWSHLHL